MRMRRGWIIYLSALFVFHAVKGGGCHKGPEKHLKNRRAPSLNNIFGSVISTRIVILVGLCCISRRIFWANKET